MKTVNPEAVEQIGMESRPLPEVGQVVLYHPRPGEVRRGRPRVPAIVMAADETNRVLTLMVMHEANDFHDAERVPEYREGERGWSLVSHSVVSAGHRWSEGDKADAIRRELEELRNIVLGEGEDAFEAPDQSVLALIDDLDGRVTAAAKAPRLVQPAAEDDAPVAGRRRRRAKG